jgi:hypothetical protein
MGTANRGRRTWPPWQVRPPEPTGRRSGGQGSAVRVTYYSLVAEGNKESVKLWHWRKHCTKEDNIAGGKITLMLRDYRIWIDAGVSLLLSG